MAGYRSEPNTEAPYRSAAESDVNIEVIFFNIFRNWWMIALSMIIAAMASYVLVSESYTPKFEANATFVVTSKGGGTDQVYNNLVVSARLAESFQYVLESPVLRQKVAESLGMDSFEGTIKTKNVENTNILEITLQANSPQVAFDEMRAVIENHKVVSESIMGSAVIDVLKAPTVPTKPLKQMDRPGKVIKYSLLAGAAVIAVIVVFSIVSDQIMTEKDLDTRVDCPALATIYHERKNISLRSKLRGVKTSMLITNPTTSFRFAETYRLFRTRLEYMMKQKGHKVLMVSSVYENEGKTTCAANAAITLAMDNKKVLLMDGDMLKPALYKVMGTRVKRGKAVNEIITEDYSFEDIPVNENVPNLSLLMARTALSNSTEVIASNEMRDFIAKAKDYYDYVVIDTPPMGLASDAECFAELADCMMIVIKQGGARAKRINECLEAISRSGAEILGCLFNNVYPLEFLSAPSAEIKTRQNYRTSSGYGEGYGRGYASENAGRE
jgi:capsular exopolysaccharide synthesis family protein